jgi:hypothetical protein
MLAYTTPQKHTKYTDMYFILELKMTLHFSTFLYSEISEKATPSIPANAVQCNSDRGTLTSLSYQSLLLFWCVEKACAFVPDL